MPEQPIQLLLIEDNRDAAYLIRKLLEEIKRASFHITHVERLAAGMEHLSAQPVDAILLDLNLPDSTGLETLTRVHTAQPNTPVIVMTGLDDETVALQAARQGAQDYLIKGKSDGELIARAIRYAMERKRAEETLRKSEERYRTILENIENGYFEVDLAGNFTFFNDALCKILGYARDEMLGMNNRQYMDKENAQKIYQAFNQVYNTGEPYLAFDWELVRKDGETRAIESSVSLIRDSKDERIGFRGVVRDITERKRAEEEILRRNAELTTLNQIGQSLNQLVAPEQIYETIANNIGRVLDNRNLYIAQYDEASQQISFPVYTIQGERRNIAGRPFGNGLTEYVIRTRAPLLVQRDLAGAMAERGIDLIGTPAHSFLAVPMCAGEKIIGVIALQDYEKENVFDEHHLELLTTIAAQAAGALENARLFAQATESARRQKALYDISAALARVHTTPELCALIVTALREILAYPFAGIFLIEPETGDRVLQAQSGWIDAPANWRHAPGQGLSENAILTGELQYTPDVTREPEYVAGRSDTRSEVDVPIKIGETILGVLVAEDPRVDAFDSSDFVALQAAANQLAVALERARLFEAQQASLAMTTRLYELSAHILAAPTIAETAQIVAETVRAGFAADACTISLFGETGHNTADFRLSVGFSPDFHQKAKGRPQGLTARVRASKDPIIATAEDLNPYVRAEGIQINIALPLPGEKENIGALFVGYRQPHQFSAPERNLMSLFANQAALALRRARLFQQAEQRLAELQAINQISAALRAARSLDEMLPILLDRTLAVMNAEHGLISLYDPASGMLHRAAIRGPQADAPPVPLHPSEGIIGYVYTVGQAYVAHDVSTDPLTRAASRPRMTPGWGGVCVPLRTETEIIGTLMIFVPLPRVVSADEVHLLTTLAEIAGNAIQRARLHDHTGQQVQRLTALRTIDQTISSSLDLRVTLDVVLNQVVAQLGVDAAAVMSLSPHSQTLEHLASRGFRSPHVDKMTFHVGEGLEGKVIVERRTWLTSHLPEESVALERAQLLQADKFVTYCGTPLIVKGKIKGVLEVFHRAALTPPAEWIEFLEMLAGQIAIALDNAEMFDTLQRSHSELVMAYDTTIEGWSHALDLRDEETEGHTQRVTELTLQLAGAMGIPETQWASIQRGALLHDIGKMGIPDKILLKPGPLTEEEWQVMRQHPEYARDLLSPIAYLRPALEIPYSHHEKWDGTGYPNGWQGEQIPLAARIFAVVDVWDAVLSNRPYRPAWTEERAREHIRAQSGTHFDPRVVDVFLEMLERR